MKRRGNKSGWAMNFGYALLMMFWWTCFGLVIWKVDPEIVALVSPENTYWPIVIVIFLAFLSTIWWWSRKLGRSILWSGLIAGFMWLRVWDMGNLLNGFLMLVLGFAVEVFFNSDKEKGGIETSEEEKLLIDK